MRAGDRLRPTWHVHMVLVGALSVLSVSTAAGLAQSQPGAISAPATSAPAASAPATTVPSTAAPVLSTTPSVPPGATPDPGQMSGLPIQVADLPPGSVAVRVIRKSFADNVVNGPVELRVGAAGRVERSTTDASGRASFSGLAAGDLVNARTVVDGEALESQSFALPTRGGVRLVLVAGVGASLPAAVPGPAVLPVAAGPLQTAQAVTSEQSWGEWIAPLTLLAATLLAFLWVFRGRLHVGAEHQTPDGQ